MKAMTYTTTHPDKLFGTRNQWEKHIKEELTKLKLKNGRSATKENVTKCCK